MQGTIVKQIELEETPYYWPRVYRVRKLGKRRYVWDGIDIVEYNIFYHFGGICMTYAEAEIAMIREILGEDV